MISKNIILRGILMQSVINICCIAALGFCYFALESDGDWNTFYAHAIKRENERAKVQKYDEHSFYKRLYGEQSTEYLLERSLKFEKVVSMFLVIYVICSVVYLISCFLNKSVGRNKGLYECFYTASFFVLLIAMAMQFLSLHTYDVNYIQWEIRNGKNVTQYNEKTGRFEHLYAKLYHPCTSESRLQMNEIDRLQLETKFGPNACQYYNTKLFVLFLLTVAWIFSFLIIVSVSDCSHSSHKLNKITPGIEEEEQELVKSCDEGVPIKEDENENYLVSFAVDGDGVNEEAIPESLSSAKHSSNSSCISLVTDNGNRNAEALLSKFRSELAMAHHDEQM